MIYKVKGSKGAVHTVDTDKVTCSCLGFKFKHRASHPILDDERYCKHLMQFKGEIHILHSNNQGVTDRPVGPNSHKGKHSRNVIQVLQEDIVKWMSEHSLYFNAKWEFCGSWRRGAQTIGDIDLLISGSSPHVFVEYLLEKFKNEADEVLLDGRAKSSYVIEGIQVDVRIIPDASWPAALCHFTGPMEENIRLRRIARSKGYTLSEYGLKSNSSVMIPVTSERDIYKLLGEKYLQPNER
jgi:DNA polymerase/3'-5' exonuclease PolX